jgi:hypothetical protein
MSAISSRHIVEYLGAQERLHKTQSNIMLHAQLENDGQTAPAVPSVNTPAL